jgi:predicted MFS family arabinose efflux permease
MDAQRKYEWRLVAIMFLVWGTLFLDRMSLLYLAPYIAPDLHLSHLQISQLAAIIALTWAISTLVFGLISDRFGRRRVLIPMIFAFSIMSIFSGLAQNFGQLLLARALMGIAEGPCWTVMNAIVERSSSPQTRGRNIGLVVSAAALVGLALAPVLSTQIAANFGWRSAFFIAGIPGLLLGVIAMIYVKEPPLVNDEGLHDQPIRLRDMGLLFFNRNILLCCLGAAGFISWLILQNAFGPLYITGPMHQDPTTAGFLFGAAGIGSFFLGFAGPSCINRFGARRVVMVFAVLSSILPLALLYGPLYNHLYLLAAILCCTQGGQAITALVIVLIPTSSVPVRLAASAIGLVTMFGEILGSVVAPIVAGDLIPTYGLGFPLEIAAGGMVLVFLAAFFVKENRQASRFAVERDGLARARP